MKYIIGDIHGNIEALKQLMAIIKPTDKDELIFLGDYADKGINTQETILFLQSLARQAPCVFIKGNHDYVWDRYLNGGELQWQEFLLKYGGVETLRLYTDTPEKLLTENNLAAMKNYLQDYLALIKEMRDYYLVDRYIALHAGLLPEQLAEPNLQFTERNYFLRLDGMNVDKKYLDAYTVVAGHTNLGVEPYRKNGYINIDLGAGYDKYLGALKVETGTVIRSDGSTFPYTPSPY